MDKETKTVLENKLIFLLELVGTLQKILAEYERNIKLKEYLLYAAEKKAEEVVELAVSVNQELLKEKEKFSVSYYDSFIDLKLFNVFTEPELKELASTAGFRNRLAHDYLDLDEEIALRSMKKIVSIYPKYVQKIKNLLTKPKII